MHLQQTESALFFVTVDLQTLAEGNRYIREDKNKVEGKNYL